MRYWRAVLAAVLPALWATPGRAQERTFLLAQERIVHKKATETLTLGLPAIPAGRQVRLALEVRVNYPYWCANNPAMTAQVNGQPIVGADLLNKPLEYHCKNGRDAFWATPRGGSWLLFSWPDFDREKVKAFDSPYAITEVDPFRFVWDITGYVKPGANAISFTHNEIIAEDHTLVLRDVRVEIGAPIPSLSGAAPAPAPTGPLPSFVPRGRQRVAIVAQLGAGGALRVNVGERTLDIISRTSEPQGRWLQTGGGEWRPLALGRPAEATWRGTGYTVARKATLCDDHVAVADTFTNSTDRLLGVMVEHALGVEDQPLEIKLGGRPHYAPYQSDGGGANPTAVARWADLALGLVAEDDILRAHVKGFCVGDRLGLADHELGLGPGQSHTIQWSIYPAPDGDYWDVINAVRRNWGSNFTIPGPHAFVDWSSGRQDDDYYRRWVTTRGLSMVTPYDAMFETARLPWGPRSRWQGPSVTAPRRGSSNSIALRPGSRRSST